MRLQVGRKDTALQPSINPITKELEVLKDGDWVPARELNNTNQDSQYHGLGRFEPIEVSKDKLANILMYLNSEKIGYSYRIEKRDNRYYMI